MANRPVRLGLMPPLTGVVSIYGREISQAGRIACEEINEAGGVLGRTLELIIEDDGSQPESAVAAAERLVGRHQCSALIGNLLSNARIAVAYRVAEPRRIPYLNFSFYEGSILSRYFFHYAALPNQQIDRMIPYMAARVGRRMYFAGNNYEWPRGSIDAAKRALSASGGEVLGEEYFPFGVESATVDGLLTRVSEAAPDVFVPYFAGADQVNLLRRFTEHGLKRRIAVVMGHYDEVMASLLPPEVRAGLYSSNTYFMTVQTRENRTYLARLAAIPDVDGIWPEGNGILTNFGEGVYICVKAFADAANRAGSLDAESLVEALRSGVVSGPQGRVRVDSATHHAHVNTYLSRCDHRGVFSIVQRFGTLPPVIPERYRHQRIGGPASLEADIRLHARMLEYMSEAVLLVEARTATIVYANGGAVRLFGYPQEALVGRQASTLIAPDDGDPGDTAASIIDVLNRSGSWQNRIRTVRQDGVRVWCSASVTTFTHPVHGEVWMGVLQDVTSLTLRERQLQESEERLRRVIDATSDGIWDWNLLTQQAYLSPRWKQILGFAPDELEDAAAAFFDRLHPTDVARVHDAVDRHRIHGDRYAVECQLRHKNGRYVWVLSRGEVVRDDTGCPVRMVGAITDITERKLAELRLAALNETLEQRVAERTRDLETTNRELESFSYSVSHDLRAPLRAIEGLAYLVAHDEAGRLSPEGRDNLRRVRASAQRMSDLIEALLRFSRLARSPVRLEPIDLSSLATQMLEELQGHSPSRAQVVIAKGLIARADRQLMRVSLGNLLENALKFSSRAPKPRVEVGWTRADGAETFFVRDNGAGFDMAHSSRLFVPFERLHTPGEFSGNGIGLATVRRIIERHGGRVWATGAPGQGATFYFTLAPHPHPWNP